MQNLEGGGKRMFRIAICDDEKIIPNLQTKSQGANSKDEKIKALKDEAKKISEKNKNKDLDNDDKRVDR